ncbi:MFS transporter [Roseateles koreensis]|uniref:MFS transporter n=1 Tax=Roseateles koreensis TaxID=2987526 RepID=A0ABT5KQB3_9BURK|nr:MFS transporter [Roseateles koreensis]MDC8784660.1 MFS transporter [Roseateles koreensis]
MTRTDSRRGRLALMVAHCAGMVDLVALPVWVGTLVTRYGFDPQQAGLLATLFLAGAVVASLVFAPRFHRLPTRKGAVLGFAGAALAFGAAALSHGFMVLAVLHALGGLSAGAALSITHGTIARSANPHRLFAFVGIALGVFGTVFMGATPPLVASLGGPVFFAVFAGVMSIAALAAAIGFPEPDAREASATGGRLDPVIWFGIVGIASMALVQAMTFSFLERVGSDHDFGLQAVTGVLVAGGIVNLAPAALAALLEKRWIARSVLMTGPLVQAILVAVIVNSTHFIAYAAAASVFAAVMIFTHTFAFGLLARLEPTGRAMAATPAMLMAGAAIGPVLGGTLVKTAGYPSLGFVAFGVAAIAVFCMSRLPARPTPHSC